MDWTTFFITWPIAGLIGCIILSEYDTMRRYQSELYDRRTPNTTTIWCGRPTPLHHHLLWGTLGGYIMGLYGLFIGFYCHSDYKYCKDYINNYYKDVE